MALVMTAAMTVGLTLYACTTKTDITLCGGFLVSMIICLFIASIFLMFFNSKPLHIIVTIFAVIIYSLYLIYDTQLVCGEKVTINYYNRDTNFKKMITFLDH